MKEEALIISQEIIQEEIINFLRNNNLVDVLHKQGHLKFVTTGLPSDFGLDLEYRNISIVISKWDIVGNMHSALNVRWQLRMRILDKFGSVTENRPFNSIEGFVKKVDLYISFDVDTGNPIINLQGFDSDMNARVV